MLNGATHKCGPAEVQNGCFSACNAEFLANDELLASVLLVASYSTASILQH